MAIEEWAKEKVEWLRKYLKLESGIPCHDTFGRVFAATAPDESGAAFLRWVGQVVPPLAQGKVVAIDGKTKPSIRQSRSRPYIWSARLPLKPGWS